MPAAASLPQSSTLNRNVSACNGSRGNAQTPAALQPLRLCRGFPGLCLLHHSRALHYEATRLRRRAATALVALGSFYVLSGQPLWVPHMCGACASPGCARLLGRGWLGLNRVSRRLSCGSAPLLLLSPVRTPWGLRPGPRAR